MNCLERKVWIFTTADISPSEEDSYAGDVLAMTSSGRWVNVKWDYAALHPNVYVKWMQIPDLCKHLREFPDE